jgi:ABC-2 type transport system permease protein
MTVLGLYAQAIAATIKRDAAVYASYRLRFVSQIFGTLFTLTVFFYVSKLVRTNAVGAHSDYYAYVVVGIVTLTVLQSALTLSALVRGELMAGNFERLVISPLGPVVGSISLVIFPVISAVLFAGFTFIIAAVLFGVPILTSGIVPALFVALLSASTFAAIGLLFISALIAFKSALGATWVIAALSIVGGVYFQVKLLPGWLRWTADIQPLTPSVDLLRHLLVGTASAEPVWLDLVKLGGFAVVLTPVAGAILWQAIKLSRLRGTLMEY